MEKFTNTNHLLKLANECREITEIIEHKKLDKIEIPTNYVLELPVYVLEPSCFGIFCLFVFFFNAL